MPISDSVFDSLHWDMVHNLLLFFFLYYLLQEALGLIWSCKLKTISHPWRFFLCHSQVANLPILVSGNCPIGGRFCSTSSSVFYFSLFGFGISQFWHEWSLTVLGCKCVWPPFYDYFAFFLIDDNKTHSIWLLKYEWKTEG